MPHQTNAQSLSQRPGPTCFLEPSTKRNSGVVLPARMGPALTLAGVLLMSACGPEAEPGPTVSVRDSSGVTIVENRGDLEPGSGGWEIGEAPTLSIGTFQGDSLQQLFRVQGAVRLPGGAVAVANAGYGQVRVYGPDGEFVRAVGRKGEGPGEFQAPALAGFLPPDTLVVVDSQLRRITLLTVDGDIQESATMDEGVGGGVYPRGMFSDGRVVVGGGFYFSSASGEELSSGYSRRSTTYRSVNRDGALVTDFGEFPGSEFFMDVRNEGGGVMMMARLIPFGKHPMAAVGANHLYFSSGDLWEIQAYSRDGVLNRLIRWDRPPRPVESQDVELFVEDQVENAQDPSQAQDIRQQYREMPVPDFMPPFASITVDAEGYLWVERYRTPEETTPVFDIFDPGGRLVGRGTLPEDADVLEIGEGFVLVLYRDELDIEYVRMYDLRRPGPS